MEDIFRTNEWPILASKLIHCNPLGAATIRQIVPLEKLLKKEKTSKEILRGFQKKFIIRLTIFVIRIYEKRREKRKITPKEGKNLSLDFQFMTTLVAMKYQYIRLKSIYY